MGRLEHGCSSTHASDNVSHRTGYSGRIMNIHKLKTGDHALIIGAFVLTENIGRSVELAAYVPPNGSLFWEDGYFDAGADGLWIVTGEDLARNTEGGKIISNLAGVSPQHLRPLHGDFAPEHQKSREVSA